MSAVLSHPLRDLEHAMAQFEEDADRFNYDPPKIAVREIRHLSVSFRDLVLKVQQLMKTVREEEINLRKTELRALQAQINPHFLYNTLDSISWMCEQGKNAEAVEMVNALARLFRISISRGHELIPIRNELQHAESYLEIQAHRYKNQFTWSIDAEESCLDYLCHKITLQPIIENAIYHGLNGLVDDGEILVSVREDGEDILFTVTDNGSGMTQEQISAIMQKDHSDRAGIGIDQRRQTMRKNRLLLLFLLASFLLSACGQAQERSLPYRIYLISKSTSTEFWRSVFAGANAARAEYNVELTICGPETEEDYLGQNRYIEEAIENHADAIVFSAISYTENAPAIDAAAEAGIKIVVIDSDVNSSRVSARIGTDNIQAGRITAAAALDTDEFSHRS